MEDTKLSQQPSVKVSLIGRLRRSGFISNKSPLKNIVVGTVGLIIVGVLSIHGYNLFFQKGIVPSFNGTSVVLPETTMTLVAESVDVLGVNYDSSFLLSSKEPLTTEQVISNLTIKPDVGYTTHQVSESEVRIKPTENFESNSIINISLREEEVLGDHTGAPLEWAFQTKESFKVLSTLPRNGVTNVPVDSGIEFVFNTDKYNDILPHVSISPSVELVWEQHKNTAVLYTPDLLEFATVYTVTLSGDLGIEGESQTLGQDVTFVFETESKQQENNYYNFDFAKQFTEIPTGEQPVFEVYAYGRDNNPEEFTITLYQYPTTESFITEMNARRSIPLWASATTDSYTSNTSQLREVGTFVVPYVKGEYTGFLTLPIAPDRGQYLVIAESQGVQEEILLQIGNVSSFISTSDTTTLVWVQDLTTGNPAVDYSVEHIGSGQVTTTDNQGVAYFDTPESLITNEYAEYFIIKGNGEVLVVPGNGGFGPENYYQYSNWYYGGFGDDTYYTYLYADRRMYLPTDTIRVWGIIKHRDDPSYKPTVKVQITRGSSYLSEQSVIATNNVELSSFGGFTEEIPVSKLTSGLYDVELVVDDIVLKREYVQIERYEKPSYSIDVKPQSKAIFAGDAILFEGSINLFEGTPVRDINLKYNGDIDGTVTSDENGLFSFPYTAEKSSSNGIYEYDTLYVGPGDSELGEYQGSGRVQVFNSSVDFDSTITYPSDDLAQIAVTAYEVSLDGINSGKTNEYRNGVRSNQEVSITITEVEYVKREVGEYYDFINKIMQKKYEYDRVTHPKGTIVKTTDTSGTLDYDMEMIPDRSYEIEISVKDPQGGDYEIKTYARYGGSYRTTHLRNGKYSLVYDENKSGYSINNVVDVSIYNGDARLPDTEKAQFMFMEYHRGLKKYTIQSSSSYSMVFESTYVPNVFMRGVYFDGRTFFATSMHNFEFNQKDRELDISVTSNKNMYQPKESVDLTITTTKNGSPVPAEVNVSVVDEAMFALYYDLPVTPLSDIYRNISSGEIQVYSSHQYPKDLSTSGSGAACFTKGTLVNMADGIRKPIELVAIGESVETLAGPNSDKRVLGKVSAVYQHQVNTVIVLNNELRVTPEHRFFYRGQWQPIGDAHIGDILIDEHGNPIPVTSMEYIEGDFDVYNLRVDEYHTYIAGGYYVHNDKGRENFVDTAYFGTVTTNASGTTTTSFNLPDNLTSWRITYQGVTRDLFAGSGSTNISVTLPMFIDLNVGKEFLLSDKPQISARLYGEAVSNGDTSSVSVSFPTLGVTDAVEYEVTVGDVVWIPLPSLKVGEHYVTAKANVNGYEDTITKYFTVIESRLQVPQTSFSVLSPEYKIDDPESVSYITLSDKNRGRYLSSVNRLKWYSGSRVDQIIASHMGETLYDTYFAAGSTRTGDIDIDIGKYQLASGGISLLPYGDADIEISAKVSAVASDQLDKNALRKYFLGVLSKDDLTLKEEAPALYGLATLGYPILNEVNGLLNSEEIDVRSRIYLALALSRLGDKSHAWDIYKSILEEYGEEASPYIRINSGTDIDDILEFTITMAQLGANLKDERAESLFKYTEDVRTTDILVVLEMIDYLKEIIPILPSDPVSFTYAYNDISDTVELKNGNVMMFDLGPEQYSDLSFSNITGNVGIAITREVSLSDLNNFPQSSNFEFTRSYNSTDIKDGDLVTVTIDYDLNKDTAYDGCYEVVDVLPSGLRPISRPYEYGIDYDSSYQYPIRVEGQEVSFCVYHTGNLEDQNYTPLVYYARTASLGTYTAEETIMQSIKARSEFKLGTRAQVKITQ